MLTMQIVEGLRNSTFSFPVLPEAYQKLVAVLDDENASIRQVEAAVSNPSILVRLLQVANSAAFCQSTVHSAAGAIHRLGLSYVRNIALCVSMRNLFSCKNTQLHTALQNVWTHCALVASMCSVLAERQKLDPSNAMTCGLLHDIGKLAVIAYYDTEGLSLDTLAAVSEACNVEIGLACLRMWNFPVELIDSIVPNTESPYGRLVQAAHYMDDCDRTRLAAVGLEAHEFLALFHSEPRISLFSSLA